ncbi:HD superfamily phosphohydrolase [Metallosphaera yellowstonensis MK1]|uniref:HD superfamily phosphohydrolase n=1 Tax=Metallosphaera yellowstonensis MK1 TaxID=671065 RepID=H2C2B6_9CREN|nr:HD domain-containing protein [Metallosphaera yellowstonensis]EHP70387.1 HD superfamily phosphohydrolase [Metallosphaera yellowstonensis MK1]
MVEKVKASIDKSLVKKVALVHDIGHMPFSHTFEDAVKILDVMEKGKNSLGKETSRKDQIEGEHADGRFRAPLQIVISLLIWTYSMEELLNIFDHITKK